MPEKMLALDLYDLERAVEQIAERARRWPIGAVVGVDDHTALLAAMAHQALGIAHNSLESVRAAGNKLLLRKALSNAGLASPTFAVHEVAADPRPLASTISYPCVLKPLFLAASRGVIRADDEDRFVEAWVRIEQLLARPEVRRRGGDDAGRILVEDYIPGTEVALEGLLSGGELDVLALFDKPDPLEGPYFAETLYITPSALARELQEADRRDNGGRGQRPGSAGGAGTRGAADQRQGHLRRRVRGAIHRRSVLAKSAFRRGHLTRRARAASSAGQGAGCAPAARGAGRPSCK